MPTIETDSTDGSPRNCRITCRWNRCALVRRVLDQARPHPHQRHVRRVVVASGQHQTRARGEQRCCGEQGHGNGRLRAKQPPPRGPSDRTPTVRRRTETLSTDRSDCRQDAEQHAGDDSSDHRCRGDGRRLTEVVVQRVPLVVHREEHACERGDEQARQHETTDAAAWRSSSDSVTTWRMIRSGAAPSDKPDREFALARSRLCAQQTGKVCAADDEEDGRHGARAWQSARGS